MSIAADVAAALIVAVVGMRIGIDQSGLVAKTALFQLQLLRLSPQWFCTICCWLRCCLTVPPASLTFLALNAQLLANVLLTLVTATTFRLFNQFVERRRETERVRV